MSRTLTEIYTEAKETRNQYLELKELNNDSKMSIIDSFTWVTSACIYSFEALMDTFVTDLIDVFNGRINGTPAYYANAMKKWQYGDSLVVDESGTKFSYSNLNSAKRIITKVSYQENYNDTVKDNVLLLKVAKGSGSDMERLDDDELSDARNYLSQIKFAGIRCSVVSRKGDILVPRVTVYYDGGISTNNLYDAIDKALSDFIVGMNFDSVIYAQKVIDAIQAVSHVTDVQIDSKATTEQGIFIAQYDDNDKLGSLTKIERKCYSASGYIKESSKSGNELNIPNFRESITLKLED